MSFPISSFQTNLAHQNESEFSSAYIGSPVNRMTDLLSNQNQTSNFPDLTSYLSQTKMCVKKLIKHSLSVKFIIAKHPQIVDYIQHNINELINIIFCDDKKLAAQGYTVFGHLQSDLIDSILQTPDFREQVLNVLRGNERETYILARACNMTALALTMNAGSFHDACDYILDFVIFILDDPIMDFFQEITQEDFSYIATQEWLASRSFTKIVTDLINTTMIDSDDYYDNKNALKLTNLFRLIEYCETSPALIENFRSPETIKALLKFPRLHHKVEDARWSALDALYCKKSIDLMRDIYDDAFTVLAEPYVVISNFRLSALHIFEKMLNYDKIIFEKIKKAPLYQIILRMILQFQENTFVLIQIEQFLQVAFKNKDINIIYANALIPPLIYEGIKQENKAMSCFVFKVIDDAVAAANKDRIFKAALLNIDEFDEFLKGPMKARRKLIQNGYGGKLPVAWT